MVPIEDQSNNAGSASSSSRDSSSLDSLLVQPGTSGTKRPLIDSGSNMQPKKRLIDDTYAASGVKLALDGIIYQSKLLGLFIKRGLDKKFDFCLATEMDAAQKFDDVVFKYKESDQDEKWTWRFLQAKHKQDSENKFITINDLTSLSSDNPFCLKKYFWSFCRIKDNKLFQGANLKDFTICTNIGFNFRQNLKRNKDNLTEKDVKHDELIKMWEGFIEKEEDLEEDAILYFETKDFKAEKFKFNAKTDLTKIIKYRLLQSILEVKIIKDLFLNSVEETIKIEIMTFDTEKLILEAEHVVKVAEEQKGKKVGLLKRKVDQVIKAVLKLKGFFSERCNFNDLEDVNVDTKSDNGKKNVLEKAKVILNKVKYNIEERKHSNLDKDKRNKNKLNVIEEKLKMSRNKISNSTTIEEIIGEIKKDDSIVSLLKLIMKTTLNEIQKKTDLYLEEVKKVLYKTLDKYVSEISVIKMAVDVDNFDNYLKEFLEKFRFVTNYPNEKELGRLINDELGKEFHLLDADLVSASFERELLDFLKNYNKGTSTFYSWKDGKNLFAALRGKIGTLMTAGLGKAYPEKLRSYGVGFDENQMFFKAFKKHLKDFFEHEDKQILHVSTQLTRLSAIKVLQSLEESFRDSSLKYNNHDSYIFLCLRTLLVQKTQEYVTNSFGKQASHDLLVIECQAKTQGDPWETTKLYSRLSLALNNSSKKIILVAQAEDSFAARFKDNKYQMEADENSFKDLDKDSQDKVLEKKVDFQGKHISLNQLIDKTSASEIIDQVILTRIIEKERISIGDTAAFSSIGYLEDYYIERTLHRQMIKTEVLKEDIGSDLLFITRINEGLNNLGAHSENMHQWENGKIYSKGIIYSPSDQSDRKIFQNLCDSHPRKNIHWLEYQEGKLAWINSKGKITVLHKYIDKDDVSGGNNSLKEEEFSCPKALENKVIIIASDVGMGKSTILTSIARKMKGLDNKIDGYNDVWIVRLNLNDYAIDKEKLRDHNKKRNIKSLNEISFKEDNIKAAIDFVSKMAVPGDSKVNYIQFQRKIFEAGLVKIVILFDGFDEISPTYKRKTHVLLKALKGSHLAQLWVTTRAHEKLDLEDLLESPTYLLNNLTEGDQKEFLNKFWKWSLKQRIQNIHEKIYEHLDKSEKNDENNQEEMTGQYLKKLKQLIEMLPDISFQYLKNEISAIPQKYPDQKNQIISRLEFLQIFIDEKDEKGNYKLDFSDYATKLVDRWKTSIKDTKRAFINVPLNLRMLAEVVFENKFQLPENSGLLGLYEEFINIKLDIFKEEKAKTIPFNQAADIVYKVYSEMLSKIHCELAVEEIFKEEKSSLTNQDKTIARLPIRSKVEKFRKTYKNANAQIQRVGLISFLSDGSPRSIHRSFADYFFSEYLITNLQKEKNTEQVQQVLLSEILVKDEYALICKFFDSQLEKNPLSDVELSDNVSVSMINNEDTVLHKVARQDHTAIINFLINKLKKYPSTLQNLLLTPGTYGKTVCCDVLYNPLYNIKDDWKIKIIKPLLEPLKDLCDIYRSIMTTRYIDTYVYFENSYKGVTLLQKAIMEKDYDVVKYFLSNAETFETILLENGQEPGETILHFWARCCHSRHKKKFLDCLYIAEPKELGKNQTTQSDEYKLEILKKLVLKVDKVGLTALHVSAIKDRHITISLLLNWVLECLGEKTLRNLLFVHNNEVATALYVAALNGNLKTVQTMLDVLKDQTELLQKLVLATDRLKTNSLFAAAVQDKRQIVSWLLTFVGKNLGEQTLNDLLKPNKSGRTALHMVAARNHHKTLLTMLEDLKDHSKILKDLVLATDDEAKTALHEAVEFECNESLNSLLDWMKVNLPDTIKVLVLKGDKNGRTALHRAALKESNKIILALLDNVKEDLDTLKTLVLVRDNYGRTALHIATNTEIVQTLLNWLKQNFEDNTLEELVLKADNLGRTALHYPTSNGKKNGNCSGLVKLG